MPNNPVGLSIRKTSAFGCDFVFSRFDPSHVFTHWFAGVKCSLFGVSGAVSPAKCAVSVPAVRQPYGWLLSAGLRITSR